MNFKVARVGVRQKDYISIENLPDFKNIQLVARLIKIDCNGNFAGVQYALYFPEGNFTVEIDSLDYLQELFDFLDKKIKTAGVNPKFAVGTVQNYAGEEEVALEC